MVVILDFGVCKKEVVVEWVMNWRYLQGYGGGGSYSPARGPPYNSAINSKRGKGRTVARGRMQMPSGGNYMNHDEPHIRKNVPRGRGCTVEYPDAK